MFSYENSKIYLILLKKTSGNSLKKKFFLIFFLLSRKLYPLRIVRRTRKGMGNEILDGSKPPDLAVWRRGGNEILARAAIIDRNKNNYYCCWPDDTIGKGRSGTKGRRPVRIRSICRPTANWRLGARNQDGSLKSSPNCLRTRRRGGTRPAGDTCLRADGLIAIETDQLLWREAAASHVAEIGRAMFPTLTGPVFFDRRYNILLVMIIRTKSYRRRDFGLGARTRNERS